MGAHEVVVNDRAWVYATIPASPSVHSCRTVALLAHLDTSPEAPSTNVRPQLHDYADGDIVLKDGIVIPAAQLAAYKNQRIITSDGTTLLGADDKAGMAAIMEMAAHLLREPEKYPHCRVRVCFTPDEEIGHELEKPDVEALGANCAYTVDGGKLGEFEDETFNAWAATVTVKGFNCHPGTALNVMVNAMRVAGEFLAMLPKDASPETTCNRQGFIHPVSMEGDPAQATIKMIIRDFDLEGVERLKDRVRAIADSVERRHPGSHIAVNYRFQYQNMKPLIDQVPEVCDIALEAMRCANVVPIPQPVRGGTDGSKLTVMGIPTPNLFAGGENFHSKTEFLPVASLEHCLQVLLHLVRLHGERSTPLPALVLPAHTE
eukprot:GAFH01001755.1.p1 GENE.GAFH01001755.1~~GAFH01001755.1.p1  ORF type:complete len:430 (-),score=119.57 GAFH01001755.1:163-1287(-)